MSKKLVLIVSLLMLPVMVFVGCGKTSTTDGGTDDGMNYKYYTAEQVKSAFDDSCGDGIVLVDIQPKDDFDKHHILGSIPTYAFPVKSDDDKAKLDAILPQLEDSKDDIVIVCPRGRSGAENTYKHLMEKGIDESRIHILEGGQADWPYSELLEK